MKNKIILAVGLISSSAMAANEPANLSVGMAVDQQLSVVVEVDNKYRISLATMAWPVRLYCGSVVRLTNMPIAVWHRGLVAGMGGMTNLVFVFHGVNWDLSKGWDVYADPS